MIAGDKVIMNPAVYAQLLKDNFPPFAGSWSMKSFAGFDIVVSPTERHWRIEDKGKPVVYGSGPLTMSALFDDYEWTPVKMWLR